MDFIRYMGSMVRGKHYTWPDSRRLANIRVNVNDVNAVTVV